MGCYLPTVYGNHRENAGGRSGIMTTSVSEGVMEAPHARVCVCACVVVVGGGVVVSGGGGGGVRVCVCGGSSLEGLYKVIDIFLMRSMAVWGHMEMVGFAEPSEDWHCASLSRSGEEGGTFTMAIAVRGKLELPGLTMAAELGAGGWLHYGDCLAPDAETEECDRRVSSLLLRNSGKADGCTMASAVRRMLELKDAQCPALPRHCLAVCSTVAADLQASADRWLGPALCGVRPADAACRCDLRSQGCTVSCSVGWSVSVLRLAARSGLPCADCRRAPPLWGRDGGDLRIPCRGMNSRLSSPCVEGVS